MREDPPGTAEAVTAGRGHHPSRVISVYARLLNVSGETQTLVYLSEIHFKRFYHRKSLERRLGHPTKPWSVDKIHKALRKVKKTRRSTTQYDLQMNMFRIYLNHPVLFWQAFGFYMTAFCICTCGGCWFSYRLFRPLWAGRAESDQKATHPT